MVSADMEGREKMSNNIVKMVTEVKEGRTWRETFSITKPEYVYRHFADDMRYRYIHHSAYYRMVKRVNHYNGFETITFYYDNGVRTSYTIESH